MTSLTPTPERLAANWRAITVELDAPRPSRIERLLRRLGLPSHLTRPLLATPAMRRAWLVATALAALIGLGAADNPDPRAGLLTLLLLAPLAPVAGVALAYGLGVDPLHEVTLATPMSGLRLVLVRTVAVLAVVIGVFGVAALLAPHRSLWSAAWLLPALTLSLVTLALGTFVGFRLAAPGVGAGWIVAVFVARAVADDPIAAFGLAGQLVCGVLAVVALAVLVVRRQRFDLAWGAP